jgi:hypothetical protein
VVFVICSRGFDSRRLHRFACKYDILAELRFHVPPVRRWLASDPDELVFRCPATAHSCAVFRRICSRGLQAPFEDTRVRLTTIESSECVVPLEIAQHIGSRIALSLAAGERCMYRCVVPRLTCPASSLMAIAGAPRMAKCEQ